MKERFIADSLMKHEESKGKQKTYRSRRRVGRWFLRICALLLILGGIGLLAYPWISNWLYDRYTSSTWTAYTEEVENLNTDEQAAVLSRAREYNDMVKEVQPTITNPFNSAALQELGDEDYWDTLSFGDSGVMAYLDIPAISVSLPIYHGTDDETLNAGIGHLEGSSLPIGGESTHAVLTGHSGLTGKKLFTDLSELEVGDYFYIRVLDEILAYRITEIQTVLPDEKDMLRVQEGEDLVTLMTCTPYGVNSHRLLVTGERVDYEEEAYHAAEGEKSTAVSSQWMKDYRNAALTALAILILLLIVRFLMRKRRKKTVEKTEKEAEYEKES